MTKEKYNEYIKPFVVLVVICLVVSALLAATHSVTEPVIEKNAEEAAMKTRQSVLPGSTDFEELDVDAAALGIISAYRETGGAGYVMTAGYKGYGGTVTVTVGLDNDGKIIKVSADVSSETPNVGTRAGTDKFTGSFVGMDSAASANGVAAESGATYSSTAVKSGVAAILDAFGTVKGASAK